MNQHCTTNEPDARKPGRLDGSAPDKRVRSAVVAMRVSYSAVFCLNVMCALQFILAPGRYAGAYELGGVAGLAAVQGMGVAFLMWNATYPVVIAHPLRFKPVAVIVVAQQAIGLLGESWIYATLPAGHEILAGSIMRFIGFDAAGLIMMGAALVLLSATVRQSDPAGAQN